MTKNEALYLLGLCWDDLDTECAHVDADEILCELLITLGYQDVVNARGEVHKWYA